MNNDWRKCIINGDSRDYINRIPDNSIDVIITDPPYNLAAHSTGNIPLPNRTPINNDLAEWDQVEFVPAEWADELVRILKPDGNLFIFTSYNMIGEWHRSLDHRFDTSNFMVWHKTNPAPKIFKAGFLNSCELIFTCWNKGHFWNFISQKEMHNFIETPICMAPERLKDPKHPAQKPIAVIDKLIEIASKPGDIVFDPFMGVGSVGVSALAKGRRYIGIEILPEYFNAAARRINHTLNMSENNHTCAEEPVAPAYGNSYNLDIKAFFTSDITSVPTPSVRPDKPKAAKKKPDMTVTSLAPLIKWPGGKEKELPIIRRFMPVFTGRFIEPFVGGGSVFLSVGDRQSVVNDLSDELIGFYTDIKTGNKSFFSASRQLADAWDATAHFYRSTPNLKDAYLSFRSDDSDDSSVKRFVVKFCKDFANQLAGIVDGMPWLDGDTFIAEVRKNLSRKMIRMRRLEKELGVLPDSDIDDNLETALKSAFYMCVRNAYNTPALRVDSPHIFSALFFFIRNYCYSGMFRYNKDGEFNVPYGGIGYNSKSLHKKIDYYCSDSLCHKLEATDIYNLDFETFLDEVNPTDNDFIFLDPPYDSDFSTYARNEFTRADQTRLAASLMQTAAKWMLVIKNTDFIYNLYNRDGAYIRSFDKKYTVSFMNRNNKDVTHLIITNYPLPD